MFSRKLRNRSSIMILLCLCLFSCGGGGNGEDVNPAQQERVAKAYLSDVLAIMQSNAVTRNEIDWGNLEAEVNQLAINATSISDTYPAITRALELIKTNHSFLTSASGAIITYPSTVRCNQEVIESQPSTDDIGYVKVGGFSSRDASDGLAFAESIQTVIKQQDNAGITGWVVDLRNNSGGNMWPMIAGLGPFFEGNIQGYFIDPDENVSVWGYENGASYLGSKKIVTLAEPYFLLNPSNRIAILSSGNVASSGEATLIAFKKQFNVKVFGTDSCGLSTANTAFPLSDGSTLFLTTAVIADREQQKYGGRVPVDQAVQPKDVLSDALSWLQQ